MAKVQKSESELAARIFLRTGIHATIIADSDEPGTWDAAPMRLSNVEEWMLVEQAVEHLRLLYDLKKT